MGLSGDICYGEISLFTGLTTDILVAYFVFTYVNKISADTYKPFLCVT